jgi:DNA-binding transcriptional ArsR family regulator
MSAEPRGRRITDPEVLKALTHPLRQRLYRLLAQIGPTTVGALGERVGADPGRVSYHLRELGKRGFIEEAPELARDRRETWWRVVPGSTSWSREDFETVEGRAVVDTLFAQMAADQFARLRHFVETAEEREPPWQRASMSNQSHLHLTVDELSEMNTELRGVFERWGQISHAARDAGETEGREPVFAFLHVFPERPDGPEPPPTER